MEKDILYTLRMMSDVIVGGAAYNTIFESIKYDNKVAEYDRTYEYDWKTNFNDNIYTFTLSDLDVASIIGKTSTLKCDISIFYFVEGNVLSQIKFNISNIISNYQGNNLLVNDFMNNMVTYLLTGANVMLADSESLYMEGAEAASEVVFDRNSVLSVSFKSEDNVTLSIRNLFLNDLIVNYSLQTTNEFLDEIGMYSTDFAESMKYIIDNQNKDVNDAYTKSDDLVSIDTAQLNQDFKEMEVHDGSTYLFNTILHQVQRMKKATLADMLIFFDRNGIELTSIEYKYKMNT
jgi:hypothetical protein